MADYTGRDQRLSYLFQNGGGGGSASLAGLSDVSLSSPSDGQVLKYDANAQEWVNSNESGGGIVNDGTAGVRIDVTIPANSSVTYSFDDLGITKRGYYIIGCASNRTETSGGWKWFGYMAYSGYYTSSYQTSYIKSLDYSYTGVTMSESAKTITFANQLQWAMAYSIEVLPLHPKIEVEKHTYSTTEQVVGTWVDGKPIYEITIATGALPNTSQKNLTTPSNIKYIIDIEGFVFKSSDDTNQRPLPFPGGGTNDIRVDLNLGTLRITTYTSWSDYEGYVTVRYTKTTD